jgi:hypothetical protein
MIGFRSRLAGLVGLIPSLLEPFDDQIGATFALLARQSGETERLCRVACRALRADGLVEIHGDTALLTPRGREILAAGRQALSRQERRQLARTQRRLVR